MFHNGQSVLNADGVVQAPDSLCAAPKVAELPVALHIDRRPDDVIMDMRFVDMGTDDKSVFSLGKPFGKFHPQPVGLLRCDLTGFERLADMVGNHIVLPAHPPGGGNVLPFCQHKLSVSYPAVTRIAGNQPPVVCFLRIAHIVDDVADGLKLGAALANVQRHNACGCHIGDLLSKKKRTAV